MEVEFADADLDQLETDPHFTAGFDASIVRGFRKAMQAIRAAVDDRDLYAAKGLHFEKLKGNRSGQRSIKINKQWRLILVMVEKGKERSVKVIGIENYH